MSRRFLTFGIAALLLVVSFSGCGGQKEAAEGEKVLRVGTTADFAPFEFQDEKGAEYIGFDMDLIRAIGREMGYEVKIQNVSFDGLIPALDAGNIDVIVSGLTMTAERKQKVLFSKPYYQSGLTIVVDKGNTDIHGFKDLAGKSIAVQIGTTGANQARLIPGTAVKDFNSSADTFMELKAGGVDAVINDRPVNDYYIVKSASKDAKVLKEVLTAEDYGVAVSKKNEDLANSINAALDRIKSTGEYDKIFEKWFGKQNE